MCGVVYWYTHVWCNVLVYTCVVWNIGVHMCGVVYLCIDIHMCFWYNTNVIACVCVHTDEVKVCDTLQVKKKCRFLGK
jgi:hypothetical protein